MMRAACVAGVVAASLCAANDSPQRSQTGDVEFPRIGKVHVEAKIIPHVLPQVIFRAARSKVVLLQTSLGSGSLDPKYIDTAPGGDPFPIVRFKVVQLEGVESPLVFVSAMEAGGSDCSYWGSVIGEVGGKLEVVSPTLPMVNAEGGYALTRSLHGDPELVAWNFIWAKNEAHVDPHAYWVETYRWNPATGTFVVWKSYEVPKTGPEISFPNLLQQIPDFTC